MLAGHQDYSVHLILAQEAALTVVAAEVSEALRNKGPNGQPTESLSTLLGLLASLTDSTSPVAQQYMAGSGPSAAASSHGQGSESNHAEGSAQESSSQALKASAAAVESVGPSSASGQQKNRSEGCDDRPQQQRAMKAYAAGALVQAALNAMAAGVQGPQPLTFLTPTSSAAAALAVQVSTSHTLHCCLLLVAVSCTLPNTCD